MAGSNIIIEGYLEKKKRRSYQGYAKRYFVLHSDGTLSYSRVQGEKVRDTVDLAKCSIGRSKKRRHLVIDSGSKVPWHCKAMNDKDFERFTAAFHNFAQIQERESTDKASNRMTAEPEAVEHLVSDRSATELVQLITAMTPSLYNLEKLITRSKQQQSPSAIGSLVGSVTSTVTGSSTENSINTRELEKHVERLYGLHQQALSLLRDSHISPTRQSTESLDRADSIYHDAESQGFAYDLDEDDFGPVSDSTSSGRSRSDSYASSSDDDSSAYESGEEGDDDDAASSSAASDRTQHGQGQLVRRRTKLPHPLAGNDVSLFGLLKRNMGKDLSKISFPVSLNEPLSGLQSMAESLQYTELLDHAVKMSASTERLLYVTVFVISTYAKYKYRTSRKPFNPMLGETYELVRPEKGLRFIGEKVSHHPNWLACHAQGKGWDFTSTESGQQKFWGRSFEIIPEGIAEIRLKESGELYTYTRPPSYVRNIMSGEKYIEHVGDMEVVNQETGERAVVHFKEGSSWGGASTRNKIEGTIFDAHDKAKIEITGKWDEAVSRKTGGKTSETIWQITNFPEDAPKWYGFSEWATQLNEITDDIKDLLPPTDSRLRPDQRAFENGDVDTAETQKEQLENAQRERRKKWENAPEESRPPQFFEEDEEGAWHYAGGYWERREKKNWRNDIQIFQI